MMRVMFLFTYFILPALIWINFWKKISGTTNLIKTDCGQFFDFKATYKNHAVCHLLDFAWLSVCRCLCSESAVWEEHWSSVGSAVDFTQDLCSVLNIHYRGTSGGSRVHSPGSKNTFQFKFSYFVKPQFVGGMWRIWSVFIKMYPDSYGNIFL